MGWRECSVLEVCAPTHTVKGELGPGWTYDVAELVERELEEGPYHRGMSAFVNVLANKTSNQ